MGHSWNDQYQTFPSGVFVPGGIRWNGVEGFTFLYWLLKLSFRAKKKKKNFNALVSKAFIRAHS